MHPFSGLLAVVFLTGGFVAQATNTGDTGQVVGWVNYGLAGLLVIGFLTGRVVPRWVLEDLKTRLAAVEAQRDRLVEHERSTTIPALIESNRIANEMLRRLEDDGRDGGGRPHGQRRT